MPLDVNLQRLREGRERHWKRRTDTVDPLGDERGSADNVFTINLNNQAFFYFASLASNSWLTESLRAPFSQARSGLLSCEDFTWFTPPSAPTLKPIPGPYWIVPVNSYPRKMAFVIRLLEDFNNEWRHILRSRYRDTTMRAMARAIICLASMDFIVLESTNEQRPPIFQKPFTSIHSFPSWYAYETNLCTIGRLRMFLNQDLVNGLCRLRREIHKTRQVLKPWQSMTPCLILLCSIRHIMLCSVSPFGYLSYTQTHSLCNGFDKPSPSAISLLILAVSYAHSPPRQTPLHHLPVQIQDLILDQLTDGPIECARLGCKLGLGLPFLWKRRKDGHREQEAIETMRSHDTRHERSPVESRIVIDGAFVGWDYK